MEEAGRTVIGYIQRTYTWSESQLVPAELTMAGFSFIAARGLEAAIDFCGSFFPPFLGLQTSSLEKGGIYPSSSLGTW